ncbi:hypothetical protein V2H77_04770, partial [Photorhabdus sp. P32]|uniref:hypothetical protein n=1 Tax=Photorhabdus sp. P32 TaxID=3117549 RepID=UPI00311B1C25
KFINKFNDVVVKICCCTAFIIDNFFVKVGDVKCTLAGERPLLLTEVFLVQAAIFTLYIIESEIKNLMLNKTRSVLTPSF